MLLDIEMGDGSLVVIAALLGVAVLSQPVGLWTAPRSGISPRVHVSASQTEQPVEVPLVAVVEAVVHQRMIRYRGRPREVQKVQLQPWKLIVVILLVMIKEAPLKVPQVQTVEIVRLLPLA